MHLKDILKIFTWSKYKIYFWENICQIVAAVVIPADYDGSIAVHYILLVGNDFSCWTEFEPTKQKRGGCSMCKK